MINFKLTVPDDLLYAWYDLTPRAEAIFADKLQVQVKPQVEQAVSDTFGQYPGPVKHPFAFGTPKSRRWYFANKVPKGSKGGSYARRGAPPLGWTTHIDFRLSNGQIIVYNPWKAAKYVYGRRAHSTEFDQRQVPGHFNTGWGADLDVAAQLVTERATNLTIDAWYESVSEAVHAI